MIELSTNPYQDCSDSATTGIFCSYPNSYYWDIAHGLGLVWWHHVVEFNATKLELKQEPIAINPTKLERALVHVLHAMQEEYAHISVADAGTTQNGHPSACPSESIHQCLWQGSPMHYAAKRWDYRCPIFQ